LERSRLLSGDNRLSEVLAHLRRRFIVSSEKAWPISGSLGQNQMAAVMSTPKALQVSCVQMRWGRSLEHNLGRTLTYIQWAADQGSRVVLFPEANLTSYYFPYAITLAPAAVQKALDQTREAAAKARIWVIAGTLRRTTTKFLNLAHVIAPSGDIIFEYAKVHMAGRDEQRYCRGGNKLSLFEIDGVLCTLVICRDGRHPELYRLPAMAGAQILFHPSCSSDEIEAVAWKRTSGRAQLPVGPNSKIFHCVANTVGESPDGKQTSSGTSFIREPAGLPLAEAGYYQEEMITAVLDLNRADRSYIKDSLAAPPFLARYWKEMIRDMKARAHMPPR
jgi:predicted amidohydrolase